MEGSLLPRSNPDKVKNAHGDLFLTFLKDNRAVILNGRITPYLNNYTFVSTRGLSVPDYIFCPLDHMTYCKKMETILVNDIINSLSLPPPPSMPDHSILSGHFVASYFKMNRVNENTVKSQECLLNTVNLKPPRKKFKAN